jgi:hypothetical protein
MPDSREQKKGKICFLGKNNRGVEKTLKFSGDRAILLLKAKKVKQCKKTIKVSYWNADTRINAHI